MGIVFSYLWPSKSAEFISDPSLDVPDTNTNLTRRQKLVIGENWALVQQNLQRNGIDFFITLFKTHPELQKYFVTMADLPLEKLATSKKLLAHATTVMMSLTSLVDNIDDVECLKELLLKIGENHGRRKVKIEEFQKVAVTFVDFLREKLGTIFTSFAAEAWQNFFKIMISIIEEGMRSETKKASR